MVSKESDHFVALHDELPAEEERVRAILACWGLEENSIYRLLTEGHPGRASLAQVHKVEPDATVTLLHGGSLPRGGYASH